MRDHYIPQYYLRGFTSPNDMVWVYEKGGTLKFHPPVKNIGLKTNYYCPEVEEYLANQIETPANAVIKKIRNRTKITKADKEKLAIYMVVMLKRVPQSKIWVKQMAPGVARKLQNELDKEISESIKKDLSRTEFLENRKNEIRANLKKYEKNPPKDFWVSLIPPERTPNAVNVLHQMTWHFLTYNEDPVFLACDNPVFYFTWMGIGKPESEVTFPISSNIVLWATWRKDLAENYSEIKKQAIREINRRTALNATRFVYHAKDEYWIPKFISKDNHQLNRLI